MDVEYEDKTDDVPIVAIAGGSVRLSRMVNGYGGVVAIEHVIADESVIAIYRHLDPATVIDEGVVVTTNQQIGVLGDGYTQETDGERKHLHFGIITGSTIDYVGTTAELKRWVDPFNIFR